MSSAASAFPPAKQQLNNMMLLHSRYHLHGAAVQLNNIGCQLVLAGRYKSAISALRDAMAAMHNVTLDDGEMQAAHFALGPGHGGPAQSSMSSMSSIMEWRYADAMANLARAKLAHQGRVAVADADAVGRSKRTKGNSSNNDDGTAADNDVIDPFVFSRPLELYTANDESHGYAPDSRPRINIRSDAAVVIYNAALAYHMMSLRTPHRRSSSAILQKAMVFYEMIPDLLEERDRDGELSGDAHGGVPKALLLAATINNMRHIYVQNGEHNMASECRTALTSAIDGGLLSHQAVAAVGAGAADAATSSRLSEHWDELILTILVVTSSHVAAAA